MTGNQIEFIYIKLKGVLQYDDFKLITQHNEGKVSGKEKLVWK